MVDKLKHIILKDTIVQVVGVHYEKTSVRYDVLKLSNRNDELQVEEQFSFNSFEALEETLETKYPLLLAFSGKGILNKKVQKTPDYKSKVLMNVNPNDFYFYESHQNKNVFISVVRKESVQDQIKIFQDAKFLIVDYSIGPFICQVLSAFVKLESIVSNKTELKLKESELEDFIATSEERNIELEEQVLSQSEVSLFATVINYYYQSDSISYENDFLAEYKAEKNFKKYFELIGASALGLFFLSLLVSYLLLGHYNTKKIETNTSLLSLQETYDKVKELENERDDKRDILNESGVFTTNFLAYYINELTTDLPNTISLSEYILFPLDKKVKQLEKIKFNSNGIVIKGESSSNANFNNWYKSLKKIKWIKKSDLIYKKNRKNRYDFEIKIKI